MWPRLSGGFGGKIDAGDISEIKDAIFQADGTIEPFYVAEAKTYVVPLRRGPARGHRLRRNRRGGRRPHRALAEVRAPRLPGAVVLVVAGLRVPVPRSKYNAAGEYRTARPPATSTGSPWRPSTAASSSTPGPCATPPGQGQDRPIPAGCELPIGEPRTHRRHHCCRVRVDRARLPGQQRPRPATGPGGATQPGALPDRRGSRDQPIEQDADGCSLLLGTSGYQPSRSTSSPNRAARPTSSNVRRGSGPHRRAHLHGAEPRQSRRLRVHRLPWRRGCRRRRRLRRSAHRGQRELGAPSLNDIFYRYDDEEVRYWLIWGRPGSPMPAWGVEAGGPLNDQQLDFVIEYSEVDSDYPGRSGDVRERAGGDRAGQRSKVPAASIERPSPSRPTSWQPS